MIVVSDTFDESTHLSGRNVPNKTTMSAAEVNVYDLLYYDKIIITQSALETLARRTAK